MTEQTTGSGSAQLSPDEQLASRLAAAPSPDARAEIFGVDYRALTSVVWKIRVASWITSVGLLGLFVVPAMLTFPDPNGTWGGLLVGFGLGAVIGIGGPLVGSALLRTGLRNQPPARQQQWGSPAISLVTWLATGAAVLLVRGMPSVLWLLGFTLAAAAYGAATFVPAGLRTALRRAPSTLASTAAWWRALPETMKGANGKAGWLIASGITDATIAAASVALFAIQPWVIVPTIALGVTSVALCARWAVSGRLGWSLASSIAFAIILIVASVLLR